MSSLGFGKARKVQIPNVFFREDAAETSVGKRTGMLYLGRVSNRKNVDVLVSAWLQLPKETREAHPLSIAGEVPPGEVDPIGQDLRERAKRSGVCFLGHVSGREKEALLQNNKVLVHTSHFENFGHSIAEGIAAGMIPILGPVTPFSRPVFDANVGLVVDDPRNCLLYTSPSPRDRTRSRMPSSA